MPKHCLSVSQWAACMTIPTGTYKVLYSKTQRSTCTQLPQTAPKEFLRDVPNLKRQIWMYTLENGCNGEKVEFSVIYYLVHMFNGGST